MAGIPHVLTIARDAEMLGEDADWLHELPLAMDPRIGTCGSTMPESAKPPP